MNNGNAEGEFKTLFDLDKKIRLIRKYNAIKNSFEQYFTHTDYSKKFPQSQVRSVKNNVMKIRNIRLFNFKTLLNKKWEPDQCCGG